MKFSIAFKYSNVTFKNKETKETVTYETKAQDGNTFTFDNVDEDVVIGIVKGIKNRKASEVFQYDDLRTNFVNVMARNKCKELYDKIDKEGWKVEDINVSTITIKDLEFTKPTMNAREALTVESSLRKESANIGYYICDRYGTPHVGIKGLDTRWYKTREEAEAAIDRYLSTSVCYDYGNYRVEPITDIDYKELLSNESNWDINMERVEVIFKKDKQTGDVVAFFPETLRDGSCNPGMLMSYEHNGQHSEASINYFMECKPCSEYEYASLLTELEQIYDDCKLVVKRRITR